MPAALLGSAWWKARLLPKARRQPASVRWIGHSTVLISVDGVRLLTDPVVRKPASPTSRRHAAPAVPPGPASMRCSSPTCTTTIWTCRRCARWIRPRGLIVAGGAGRGAVRKLGREVEELERRGDEIAVGGARVLAVEGGGARRPARGPWGSGRRDARLRRGGRGGACTSRATRRSSRAWPASAGGRLRAAADLGLGLHARPGGHMDPGEGGGGHCARSRPRLPCRSTGGRTPRSTAASGGRPPSSPIPARRSSGAAAEQAPDVEVRVLAPGEVARSSRGPRRRERGGYVWSRRAFAAAYSSSVRRSSARRRARRSSSSASVGPGGRLRSRPRDRRACPGRSGAFRSLLGHGLTPEHLEADRRQDDQDRRRHEPVQGQGPDRPEGARPRTPPQAAAGAREPRARRRGASRTARSPSPVSQVADGADHADHDPDPRRLGEPVRRGWSRTRPPPVEPTRKR